jgi:hypothetical protein
MMRSKKSTPQPVSLSDSQPVRRPPTLFEKGFDWFFRLTHRSAQRRLILLIIGFFGLWLLTGAATYRTEMVQSLLQAINGESLMTKLQEILRLYADFGVLKRLVLAFAAYSVAYNLAGIYLGDVFERSAAVGRRFIFQAAFGGSYGRIHVREGMIASEDQDSPIVQIGGPGTVVVELDSAVLLEGPYGFRVIPGGQRQQRRFEIIHGFERIRQGVYLRDRLDSQTVWARTRDGIPVTAEDINYSYSIFRGGQTPTEVIPYPFDEQAVINQVYRQTRPAKNPAESPDWKVALPKPIYTSVNRQIGEFISSHTISEILANIGDPELAALDQTEKDIEATSRHISGTSEQEGTKVLALEPGRYISRTDITNRFNDERFKQFAAGIGFQLNWIGVGTWTMPPSSIMESHVQAWRLSRENFERGEEEELLRLEEEARLQETMRLLQERLAMFRQSQAEHPDQAEEVVAELLADYHELLRSALDLFQRDGNEPPLELLDAIRVISERRGRDVQWVGF